MTGAVARWALWVSSALDETDLGICAANCDQLCSHWLGGEMCLGETAYNVPGALVSQNPFLSLNRLYRYIQMHMAYQYEPLYQRRPLWSASLSPLSNNE